MLSGLDQAAGRPARTERDFTRLEPTKADLTPRRDHPDIVALLDLEAAAEAIHRAESSVAQQDWARAWGPSLTALFAAERGFLPGEDAPWIAEIRHRLAELHVRALECYAATGLSLGGTELAAAVRAGQQLTRLAPLRESGYRYLMRALAAQDNVAEALGVYGQLSDCLRDQLGVSPSPATRELYGQLLAAT